MNITQWARQTPVCVVPGWPIIPRLNLNQMISNDFQWFSMIFNDFFWKSHFSRTHCYSAKVQCLKFSGSRSGIVPVCSPYPPVSYRATTMAPGIIAMVTHQRRLAIQIAFRSSIGAKKTVYSVDSTLSTACTLHSLQLVVWRRDEQQLDLWPENLKRLRWFEMNLQ